MQTGSFDQAKPPSIGVSLSLTRMGNLCRPSKHASRNWQTSIASARLIHSPSCVETPSTALMGTNLLCQHLASRVHKRL